MRTLSPCFSFLLLILLLVSTSITQAQDYLITTKGDSIIGELKPLVFGPDKKVQVTGSDKKKVIYKMFQISRFKIKEDLYQPVKGPSGYAFMKVIKSGYLSLMAFQMENQVTYDGRYLLKRDGRGTEVPNLSFKKVLSNFLSECNELSAKIESGDRGKRELELIVDEYNACIASKSVVKRESTPPPNEPVQKDETKLIAWNKLESDVNQQIAFEGKENVLEMIQEIKGKIGRNEKIPNFLIQGLKESLTIPSIQESLQAALNQLKP